jgi:sigma-B regulation protein RsbU (phosphoserine phosphatase)
MRGEQEMEMAAAEDQVKSESRLRLMLEINRKINSSLDLDEVLNFILDSVKIIIPYDAAEIYLLNAETQTVEYFVGRGYDESEREDVPLKKMRGIVGRVIATGEAVLAPEVSENPYYMMGRESTRSQLTVPIVSDGTIIGAFNLESDQSGHFTHEDLEWLTVLATQAAISIDKAILHQELIEKKRLEEQLRIARDVQLSLLPKAAPRLEALDIAGLNIPSEDIGGDYFDFIPIVEGHLGVVVADVAGKGIPAALIMAGFRAFLLSEIRNNYAIRTIFAKVNNLLQESLKEYQFVTAFYGVLDLARRRFTYSNAGHHPPILFRADGQQRYLKSGGPVLGMFEGTTYNERFMDLVPGDILLLYTDGLVEAENEAREMFGRERLEPFVRAHVHLGARQLCEALYAEMKSFTGEKQLKDDTTIVVIKLLPPTSEGGEQ